MGKVFTRPGRKNYPSGAIKDKKVKSVVIPEHLDWFIWRLVLEGGIQLREIETFYDLNDIYDAHELLDIRGAVNGC